MTPPSLSRLPDRTLASRPDWISAVRLSSAAWVISERPRSISGGREMPGLAVYVAAVILTGALYLAWRTPRARVVAE